MSNKTILLVGDIDSTCNFIHYLKDRCTKISYEHGIFDNSLNKIITLPTLQYDTGITHRYINLLNMSDFQIIKKKLEHTDIDYVICTVLASTYNIYKWYKFAKKIIRKNTPYITFTHDDENEFDIEFYNEGNKHYIKKCKSIIEFVKELHMHTFPENFLITPKSIPKKLVTIEAVPVESVPVQSDPVESVPVESDPFESMPELELELIDNNEFLQDLDKLIKLVPHYINDLDATLKNIHNFRLRSLARKINNILFWIRDTNEFSFGISLEGMNVFMSKKLLMEYFKTTQPNCMITKITDSEFILNW